MEFQKVSLHNIAGGSAIKMANEALDAVLDNILDENTPPLAVRGVNIEIMMKPDETRKMIAYAVKVKPKFAGKISQGGFMSILPDKGELILAEPKPEQLEFDFEGFEKNSGLVVSFEKRAAVE